MATTAEAAAALEALKAASKDDESFYDRERELNELVEMVERKSVQIVVLSGPVNSGKSEVLKRMEALFNANSVLKAAYPVFRIDLRLGDYSTPELAARAIAKQLRSWASWFEYAAVSILKGVCVDCWEIAEFTEGVPEGNLAAVIAALQRLAYASPQVRPIFMIDEADKLKLWEPADAQILMDGFVAMTKQDKRATVMLSSSDDFFRSWFKRHVNVDQWTAVGVGYFNEKDAKCCFSRMVPGGLAAFKDEQWKQIFKVCGGNPLALTNCANKFGRDLGTVLEGMVKAFSGIVEAGVVGELEKDGWDGEKFEQVMKLIVEHGGAVGLSEVCRCAFSSSGVCDRRARSECRAQVEAMRRENFIHVRYWPDDVFYSDLERDCNSEDTDYVMATSPAHLVAMERYLSEQAIGVNL